MNTIPIEINHSAPELPTKLWPFIWRYLKNKKLFLTVFFLPG